MTTQNIESGERMSASEAARSAADTLRTFRRHYLVGLAAAGLAGLGLMVAPAEEARAFEGAGIILFGTVAACAYGAEKRTHDLTRSHRNVLSETGAEPDLPSYPPSKLLAIGSAGAALFVGAGSYVSTAAYQEVAHGQLAFGESVPDVLAAGSALGIGLGGAIAVIAAYGFMERELRQYASPEAPSALSEAQKVTEL